MTDRETLDVYDARARDYAAMTNDSGTADPNLGAFIARVTPGGRVLDLGCGPGASAAVMAGAGFRVDATDGSPEMVDLAAAREGVTVWVAHFDEIGGDAIYDGIWANFSLLHAPRAAMPGYLAALHKAVKPGGVFHIGTKLGTGEKRDGIGRFYTYYADEELTALLQDAGFSVETRSFGQDIGLDGVMADWICILAHA